MGDDKIRAHCPNCGPAKNAAILHEEVEHWDCDPAPIDGTNTYRMLKCLGCDQVYYHITKTNSEDVDYYYDEMGETQTEAIETIEQFTKIEDHSMPAWEMDLLGKDDILHDLLTSVYKALNENLLVLAAIGIRTCFDRASEYLDVPPDKPFQKKLDDLEERGYVGKKEKEKLSSLINAGSAAAHRGWKPKTKQLTTMLEILEGFIHGNIVITGRHIDLKKRTPARPKK